MSQQAPKTSSKLGSSITFLIESEVDKNLRNIIREGEISLFLKSSAAFKILLEISSPVPEVRFSKTF